MEIIKEPVPGYIGQINLSLFSVRDNDLAGTRTARAFMLLGRVAGTFD